MEIEKIYGNLYLDLIYGAQVLDGNFMKLQTDKVIDCFLFPFLSFAGVA